MRLSSSVTLVVRKEFKNNRAMQINGAGSSRGGWYSIIESIDDLFAFSYIMLVPQAILRGTIVDIRCVTCISSVLSFQIMKAFEKEHINKSS